MQFNKLPEICSLMQYTLLNMFDDESLFATIVCRYLSTKFYICRGFEHNKTMKLREHFYIIHIYFTWTQYSNVNCKKALHAYIQKIKKKHHKYVRSPLKSLRSEWFIFINKTDLEPYRKFFQTYNTHVQKITEGNKFSMSKSLNWERC